jgi:folate-binding protein YgfZ
MTMPSNPAAPTTPSSSTTLATSDDGSENVGGNRGVLADGAALQGEVAGGSEASGAGIFAAHCNASHPVEYIGVLEHLGTIRVSGADAESFLQGQLSNDVFALRPKAGGEAANLRQVEAPYPRAQWTGYCTPKGRLIFTGWLARVDASHQVGTEAPSASSKPEGNYLLFLDWNLVEPVIRRLRMFVLRAKVRLEDLSQTLAIAGVIRVPSIGDTNASVFYPGAAEEQRPAPAEMQSPASADEQRPALATEQPFADPIVLPEALLASGLRLERSLRVSARGVSARGVSARGVAAEEAPFEALWHWLHHLAAEAWVGHEVSERFVPQMLNFERIDGVNFRKGCYPGQEVVARSQYLGKLKRRMALFAWEDPRSPPPPTGQDLGEDASNPELAVVSSATLPQGRGIDGRLESQDAFTYIWGMAYPGTNAKTPPPALILAEGRSDAVPVTLRHRLDLPYALRDT